MKVVFAVLLVEATIFLGFLAGWELVATKGLSVLYIPLALIVGLLALALAQDSALPTPNQPNSEANNA
jgi:hypothetical protein